MNGRRMLRASAACEEPATWTKPQGATGGVPGVNGVGPLQGTHTHRYKSDLFLPSRFRKANQLPLTVKPQTYQPNTFLKVLFEAVSTSY